MPATRVVSRFRVTYLETPSPRTGSRVARSDIRVRDGRWRSQPAWPLTVSLDENFFLQELLDVDISEDEALLDFVRSYGMPWIELTTHRHWLLSKSIQASIRFGSRSDCTPGAVRWVVRVLRALVRHWLSETSENPSPVLDAWAQEGFNPPDDVEAWGTWIDLMNLLLEPYAPHLELAELTGEDGFEVFGWSDHHLESAVALQLVTAFAKGVPAKICANDACGQLFLTQRGRSKHGQNRSKGVLYCSTACASAVSSRKLRDKRKRQENP